MNGEAATALQHFPDEPLVISLQGLLHARRNQRDLALKCVRRALESPRSFGHTHHTYYQIACLYAALGDTDKGDGMAGTQRRHRVRLLAILSDRSASRLREEPEFSRLTADLEDKYSSLKIRSRTLLCRTDAATSHFFESDAFGTSIVQMCRQFKHLIMSVDVTVPTFTTTARGSRQSAQTSPVFGAGSGMPHRIGGGDRRIHPDEAVCAIEIGDPLSLAPLVPPRRVVWAGDIAPAAALVDCPDVPARIAAKVIHYRVLAAGGQMTAGTTTFRAGAVGHRLEIYSGARAATVRFLTFRNPLEAKINESGADAIPMTRIAAGARVTRDR